ncbi:MAG: GNAT family N-acetyltransferase [Sphingobacteriales bacterium]|jgi:ribosomal protein S18 acetylase RimI-like enzyme|nr:MAG: GNAT family N-acetyltransferase [Sphingobacteriales bacterium]
MDEIKITKATVNELMLLQSIAKQTFYETFASYNSEENMSKYLAENFAEDKILLEINNTNSEFYFAIYQHKEIGYLKINFGIAQTEKTTNNSLEIERIYVLKEFHGRNVGQLLYEKAIKIAKARKVNYVWLGVWENNKRAINFYKKNNFIEFDKHIFKLGDELQTDIMMKLEI